MILPFELHSTIKEKNAIAAQGKTSNTVLELCRLSQEVFIKNEDGKKLLDLLKEIMILNSETVTPQLSAAYAYYNEGRNSVIKMLSDCAEAYPDVFRSEQMKREERKRLVNKNNENNEEGA